MLEITASAAKKFKEILKENNAEGHGIRIYRAGGG